MPYIKPDDKEAFIIELEMISREIKTPGELNFAFTILAKEYFLRTKNYQAINDIIGALEGAKLEFYRRIAVPYEDTKIKENGDVY